MEELGNGRMESEMQDVYDELLHRDIPVELFIGKRLVRRKLTLAKDTLVVGYVETILAALQQLGVSSPPTNDYPSSLQPYFHRRIWKNTLQGLYNWLLEGNPPVFAKPDGRKKRFTGHVFQHMDDLQYTEGASKITPIWCSEVVDWLSEYRVFVINGEMVGIQHYAGKPEISINEQIVIDALSLFEKSDEVTAAYALDFGVLVDGNTALVEWNDGFSLGSYRFDKKLYTDLLIARWVEIVGQSST